MAGDLDRRIQQRAYEIWESEGRPEGRSAQHWQQARAEFSEAKSEAGKQSRGRPKSASGKTAPVKATGSSAGEAGAAPKARKAPEKSKPKPKPRTSKA